MNTAILNVSHSFVKVMVGVYNPSKARAIVKTISKPSFGWLKSHFTRNTEIFASFRASR